MHSQNFISNTPIQQLLDTIQYVVIKLEKIYIAIYTEKNKISINITISMPIFHRQEVKYFNKHLILWSSSTQTVLRC